MSLSVSPYNPTQQSGVRSKNPPDLVIQSRAPTSLDYGYFPGTFWMYNGFGLYVLLSIVISPTERAANWLDLATGSGNVNSLTGNDNVHVFSVSGNIRVIGAGGILTSGSANTLTITGSGSGTNWVNVMTSTQAIVANTGYVMSNGSTLVTLTLPSTAAIGDTYIIQGQSSGGWKVNVGTGQIIHIGNTPTTTSTGSIASTNQWDEITIRCTTANSTFSVAGPVGNFIVT